MADEARPGKTSTEVVLQVCVKCGTEYSYEDGETPPADLTCEKCGGEVFRRFDAVARPGEVRADHAASTTRDLDPDDPATDTAAGDLHDLNAP
ncbi:MAG: hypothetical protein P8177_06730 [Gemmatimonadota bacterium]|jgi:predicted  nucleic acid-binding Zn-ribbon protein